MSQTSVFEKLLVGKVILHDLYAHWFLELIVKTNKYSLLYPSFSIFLNSIRCLFNFYALVTFLHMGDDVLKFASFNVMFTSSAIFFCVLVHPSC